MLLDEVVVWVMICWEQTLVSVYEGGDQFAFTHPDVCQLAEGVVNANIINISERFDQQFIGPTDLLATNGIFWLAG